ncbi:hypothetical protein GH130_11770 [Staphylococcus pseudintermedius]|uniref:hypothetical protein n=1 Tax=Staphylococcus TaxID=1279 RepID=UPI0019F5A593|nr:hypothetical protein [Staphylococcus pseudintermedius]EGQ3940681.1 hypothetical protein [Staphylococcus pseudintermedius]MDF0070687.1 hypothetical protein [Staphylococcus pseudintermedius]MDF0082662.1 hypothetical protein [Staphylococcus pseudintermedius]
MKKSFNHKETIDLNFGRYNQYKRELLHLYKRIDLDEHTKNIYRMNANINMALNSLLNNLEQQSFHDKETVELMRKFIELLKPYRILKDEKEK